VSIPKDLYFFFGKLFLHVFEPEQYDFNACKGFFGEENVPKLSDFEKK